MNFKKFFENNGIGLSLFINFWKNHEDLDILTDWIEDNYALPKTVLYLRKGGDEWRVKEELTKEFNCYFWGKKDNIFFGNDVLYYLDGEFYLRDDNSLRKCSLEFINKYIPLLTFFIKDKTHDLDNFYDHLMAIALFLHRKVVFDKSLLDSLEKIRDFVRKNLEKVRNSNVARYMGIDLRNIINILNGLSEEERKSRNLSDEDVNRYVQIAREINDLLSGQHIH